jgi:signal transduction histidine kinase
MREALLQFFQNNQIVVYAIYGQTFFILGLATALQSRKYSRLKLAGSLPLLAGFGLTHGLVEWGYIFIPMQAQYLPASAVEALHLVQMFLLVSSFTMLLRFGVQLNTPELFSPHWGRVVPWTWYGVWWASLFAALLSGLGSPSQLHPYWEIVARYTMAFPGEVLAAYGLCRHADYIRSMGLPHVVSSLRLAGLALAVYAFFSGLVGPAAPFFPANWLNSALIEGLTGIPVPIFRSACGLVLTYSMIRALEVFQLETDRLIEDMERRYLLTSERERIGRELHDGTIQSIYAAGLMIEDAARRLTDEPATARARLDQAMSSLNQTIQDIRRYIFELRTANGSAGLAEEIKTLVKDFRVNTLVEVELRTEGQPAHELSPDHCQQVVQIVREALSNIARHAHARRVVVSLHWHDDEFSLEVGDDGMGFDVRSAMPVGDSGAPPAGSMGRGLWNMRERAELLGGRLELVSAPGQGTRVRLDASYGRTKATNADSAGR